MPQGFTLYTDAEEVPDVSPVSKLAGHSRSDTQFPLPPKPLQSIVF